jgi:outer membrane biosynthesis protein TonB
VDPRPVIDAGEETIKVADAPIAKPVEPKSDKPPPVKKPPKPPVVARVDKPVEKPQEKPVVGKDEPIPEGTGKLLVSVGGNQDRSSVAVQGEDWGQPPTQKKMASGIYKVSVKLADGNSASFKATVMPDKTTVLTLDPASLKWTSQYK